MEVTPLDLPTRARILWRRSAPWRNVLIEACCIGLGTALLLIGVLGAFE